MPTVSAKIGTKLIDVLVAQKIAESKTQARRLFEDGAVKDLERDQKITDPSTEVTGAATLKIGKKIFLKIEAERSR